MEIQASLTANEICIGSTFRISGRQANIADVIVFGNRVTGFVTLAQEARMVVDIRTAVLDCCPAVAPSGTTDGMTWEVCNLVIDPVV